MSRRTSASGDFDSRNCRVMRRSSSCSSEKAKFMDGHARGRPERRPPKACTRVLRSPVMDRVGIRELRNNVAAVVRRAAGGERVVVTVDGVPAAQIGPLEAGARAGVTLDDLVAAGLVRPPGRRDPPEAPVA